MEPTPPSAPIETTKTIVVPMKTANAYSARIDSQSSKAACPRATDVAVAPRCSLVGRISVAAGTWSAIQSTATIASTMIGTLSGEGP
jgi:hypothetical protein